MNDLKNTSAKLTLRNYLDHMIARVGILRSSHIVEPGLYRLGNPDENAAVFVTANYTLSFDALRSNLTGIDCYIMVLDTKGVNVWCAAGKGTFSSKELIHRINISGISDIVAHKKLILPQLGAPGIAAHEVKNETGFKVVYGPVRAEDIPEYLGSGNATNEMRKVKFTLKDRLTLIPIEVFFALLPISIISVGLYFLSGILPATAFFASAMSGVTFVPILLPWIPTPNFVTKGYIFGHLVTVPFIIILIVQSREAPLWYLAGWISTYLLVFPVVTAFTAFNLPGITTFTSWSGVRREIKYYAPIMAKIFLPGFALLLVFSIIGFF